MDLKSTLKKSVLYGLALEIAGIGGLYYMYRKYTRDEGKHLEFQIINHIYAM